MQVISFGKLWDWPFHVCLCITYTCYSLLITTFLFNTICPNGVILCFQKTFRIFLDFSPPSSSSSRAIITDTPDPLSPPPIVHRFRSVFRGPPRIYTELLYVGSSWSPWICSSMWWGPQEYITYELVPTSTAVSCMSGLSDFDSFRDGWLVSV